MRTCGIVVLVVVGLAMGVPGCGDVDGELSGTLVVVELPAAQDVDQVLVTWVLGGCYDGLGNLTLVGGAGCAGFPEESGFLTVHPRGNVPGAQTSRGGSRVFVLPAGRNGTAWDVTLEAYSSGAPDQDCSPTTIGIDVNPPGSGHATGRAVINCGGRQQGTARIDAGINDEPVLENISYNSVGYEDGMTLEGFPNDIAVIVIDADGQGANPPQSVIIDFGGVDEIAGEIPAYQSETGTTTNGVSWLNTGTYVIEDSDPDMDGNPNDYLFGVDAIELDRSGIPINGATRVADIVLLPMWDPAGVCWEPNIAGSGIAGWGHFSPTNGMLYTQLAIDSDGNFVADHQSATANRTLCPDLPPNCPPGCIEDVTTGLCVVEDGTVLGVPPCLSN